MDILNPQLVWIESRCYRVNNVQSKTFDDDDFTEEQFTVQSSQPPEEDLDDNFVIDKRSDGSFVTSINIPCALCGYVIGAQGRNKKRLESETKTRIILPRQCEERITFITGSNRKDVATARRRIETIVQSARHRQDATHFISLPLANSAIISKFEEFKQSVLEQYGNERGVVPAIFQNPEKLHLTIGTMVLLNEAEREKARQVLLNCRNVVYRPIFGDEPLVVKMQGIEYMNDDPAEVDVLYAKVATSDGSSSKLQLLADKLVAQFVSEGLMEKQYEHVKLHATVMNTIFNSQSTTNRKQNSFNATKLLKVFQNFDFGTCGIPAIHVSQRHSQDKDGYYAATAKLSLR